MSVQEETIRLLWEVKGQQAVADVEQAIKNIGREEANLKALFQAAAISEEDLAEETERLGRSKFDLKEKLEGLNRIQKTLNFSTKNLTQGFQAAGYAVQDFASTSGDLGAKLNSVTNNIQSVVGLLGIGGPYGVAIALGVSAGVALYRNWDSISGLWEDRKPIDTATEGLDGLKDAIQRNEKALDKLREKESLNAEQMAGYNKLLKERTELEKKLGDEQERQKLLKESNGPSAEEKERGEGFKKALDGRGDEATAKIQAALEKEAEYEIARARARAEEQMRRFAVEQQPTLNEQAEYNAKVEKELETLTKTLRTGNDRLAGDLMLKALKGDQSAIDRILGLTKGGTGVNFGKLPEQIRANSPEGKKADKEEWEDLERGMKEVEAEWEANKKLVEALNKQGQENQQAGVTDRNKQAAQGAKAGDKDLDAEAKTNERGIDAEVKKIRDTLGKQLQGEYEQSLARNAALAANGAPVARSRAEERRLRSNGQAYALPQEELERRNRAYMAEVFRRRGAGEQSANLAARGIQDAGNQDLQRRAAQFGGGTLSLAQQTVQLTQELSQAYSQMDGTLRVLKQEVANQRQQVRRTAQRRGQR